MAFLKPGAISPHQVNPEGQLIAPELLKRERRRFSACTVLYTGEEGGLGGIPSVIIRMLGGDQRHVGFINTFYIFASAFQFVGTHLLRWKKSNQRAMMTVLFLSFLVTAAIALLIFSSQSAFIKPFALWGFLFLIFAWAVTSGALTNVDTNWVGDMIPKNRLGWFTSSRIIFSVLSAVLFSVTFGKIADHHQSPGGYALVYAVFALSYIIAALLLGRSIDRIPKTVHFFGDPGNRPDYKSPVLWLFIAFALCWMCGRPLLLAFIPVFMLDQFGWNLSKIAWLTALQLGISVPMLFLLGRITDRTGHRIPLMIVSAVVSLSTLLWVSSAWYGIGLVFVATVINSLGLHVHGMLLLNFALEIFPAKGRSAYFGFYRIVTAPVALIVIILGGTLLNHWKGHYISLSGAQLNGYHLLFMISALISFLSIVPLAILGKRRMGTSDKGSAP